ncbi:MAG TPA: LptA/OstA family protein [Stellaceae bacterium]|nr:LptA/OstA family protein [Stellaceae bacterium]
MRLPLLLLSLLLLPGLASAEAAAPQGQKPGAGLGFDFGKGEGGKAVHVEADQGIEWRQSDRVYIARGNAKVTRGNATVHADTLTAHYRPAKAAAGKPADTSDDPAAGTEIYYVEADGHVRFETETQTVTGDRAVYDLDQATVVVTGKDLKLVTPKDTVTAQDSLEWWDQKQLAVARGNATAVREGKRVTADVLMAEVERDEKGGQHISRIDAQGNVVLVGKDQVGRGDSGVYNVETGIATLVGHVRLTRGENELRGNYAVVDLNNNLGRLLGSPPSDTLTGGRPQRVEGLIVPRQGTAPGAPKK